MLRALKLLAGATALAVLLVSVPGVGAAPAPEEKPKQDEPKKEEPKKQQEDPLFPGLDLEELLKNFPAGGGIDPEQFRQMQQEMQRMVEEMRKQFPAGRMGVFDLSLGGRTNPRLGARVAAPGATLADQLDLPKGQGVVLEEVAKDSAAAKAGMRAHDILLELNGKPVPSDRTEFGRMLQDVKADTPVDAVVLRKGKKETIKGLTLPEARAARPALEIPNIRFPIRPAPGGAGGGALFPRIGGLGDVVTVSRINDQFTATSRDNGTVITVTGSVTTGKASEITVKDGGTTNTYKSVEDVPEQYREKVRKLEKAGLEGPLPKDD
jgi:membrane-associated protease RseP (regulator of RpoE activity)